MTESFELGMNAGLLLLGFLTVVAVVVAVAWFLIVSIFVVSTSIAAALERRHERRLAADPTPPAYSDAFNNTLS